MSLRKRAKKIPDAEAVVYYEETGVAGNKGTPEVLDLMAKAVISAKRKYVGFIVEHDIRESGRVISFRVTMLLKPAKKEKGGSK